MAEHVKTVKTIEEISIMELARTARVLQRQLKILRPLPISGEGSRKIKEIIDNLEREFRKYRI